MDVGGHIRYKRRVQSFQQALNIILLSYIIPLYNASSSIVSCLDSIYAEKSAETEYEVIVVDDGSTDAGSEIVSQYSSAHTNLRLFRQTNKGAAEARNRGLEMATGQWIRFVDADDRIMSFQKPVTEILQKNRNVDLLTFNYVSLRRNGEEYVNHYGSVQGITGIDILRQLRMYLWDKIFSRKLIGTQVCFRHSQSGRHVFLHTDTARSRTRSDNS